MVNPRSYSMFPVHHRDATHETAKSKSNIANYSFTTDKKNYGAIELCVLMSAQTSIQIVYCIFVSSILIEFERAHTHKHKTQISQFVCNQTGGNDNKNR